MNFETVAFLAADEDQLPARLRYAPMKRLLLNDDEVFLREKGLTKCARMLRREHRRCYHGYLRYLAKETRQVRAERALGMASADNWDVPRLLRYERACELALVQLRWLEWKHLFRLRVDPEVVERCLAILLPGIEPIEQAI